MFTDLNFADDVGLLAEMLEVVVFAMTIMQEVAEVFKFDLQINWSKTKILQDSSSTPCSTVQVADGHIEVVDAFVYLCSMINSSGGSRGEVLRGIGMNLLEKKNLEVKHQAEYHKIRVYQTYCPVLLSITMLQCCRIDALDMWALRKILEYHTLAMSRMWKSEQPPDAVLFPIWSLTDVCGSSDILPAAHHKKITVLSVR